MDFLQNNWSGIAELVMLIAMLVNGHTPHWKSWPTIIGKIAGLIVKMCALWTADKQSTKPSGKAYIASILLLVGCTGVHGCANLSGTLDTAHLTAVEVRKVSMPIIDKFCMEKAVNCKSNGVSEEKCEQLKLCQSAMKSFGDSLKGVHIAYSAGKMAMSAGNIKDARGAWEECQKALVKAYSILRSLGIPGVAQ